MELRQKIRKCNQLPPTWSSQRIVGSSRQQRLVPRRTAGPFLYQPGGRTFQTNSATQSTIKSLATMISPLKYCAAGARQVLSLTLSMAGVRCERTSVVTLASAAMRPTSSTGGVVGLHVRHGGIDADRPAVR